MGSVRRIAVPQETTYFAAKVGRDLEDDIRDVEDTQERVVVVSRHLQVLLETSEAGIACR